MSTIPRISRTSSFEGLLAELRCLPDKELLQMNTSSYDMVYIFCCVSLRVLDEYDGSFFVLEERGYRPVWREAPWWEVFEDPDECEEGATVTVLEWLKPDGTVLHRVAGEGLIRIRQEDLNPIETLKPMLERTPRQRLKERH